MRGLDVEQGLAVEYLRTLEPASLGGIVMIQVIEHLSPQQVIDFVALAAEKVRPGGKVVLETVNPVVALHVRARVLARPRSRAARAPQLLGVPVPGGGVLAARDRVPVARGRERAARAARPVTTRRRRLLNENFERIGALLFGAQDYAVIATR